ncbi:hypothetical protein [Metabacillus iocasae]|uniref:Uncharacterized protein n=1 Tax=Priestia iocasae TaxID=2291674 RepID=A0ABS2QX13_9BACI|nr:hypothetical protein [Metabacillus iocasae]MBM7703537.1 hypothetical protein [Metabacillus iocasae]
MKTGTKIGFVVSIVVLTLFPVIFLLVSWLTGEWRFFWLSLAPTLSAGLTGLLVTLQVMKKEEKA